MTPVEKRMEIERKLVRHLIRSMKKFGWEIRHIDDGGERINPATEREAMDTVFSVDECWIYFHKLVGDRKVTHWAYIVLGNDGWDAIADYSYSPDGSDDFQGVMNTEVDSYSDKLEEEAR